MAQIQDYRFPRRLTGKSEPLGLTNIVRLSRIEMSCNELPLPPAKVKTRRVRNLTSDILANAVMFILTTIFRVTLTPAFESGAVMDIFVHNSGEALKEKWKKYVDDATGDIYLQLTKTIASTATMKFLYNSEILLLDNKLTSIAFATTLRCVQRHTDDYFARYYEFLRANIQEEIEDEDETGEQENFILSNE